MITTNVIQRTFHIRYGGLTGTAFAIDREGKQYLITAKHVVPDIATGSAMDIFHDKRWKTIDLPPQNRSRSCARIAAGRRGVGMARKRYTAEQILAKLREAEVVLAQGESVAKVARRLGVAEQTYYRWRREYAACGWTRRSASRIWSARSAAEEAGGRPGAGQRHPQGGRVGTFLSPARRRQAHARADRAGRLGASGLSGPRPAAQHAAAPRPGGDGRARPDRPDHRPGPPLRPFRLPAHHGPAAGRGLVGEPQAGGAAVASGGAARAPHAPRRRRLWATDGSCTRRSRIRSTQTGYASSIYPCARRCHPRRTSLRQTSPGRS